MGNLLLIIGMMMPRVDSIKPELTALPKPKVVEVVAEKLKVKKIKKGMTVDELVEAFGEPSSVLHDTYGTSTDQFDRFFFEDEPCQFHFRSCSVDIVDGKVSSFSDVKYSLTKLDSKERLVSSRK